MAVFPRAKFLRQVVSARAPGASPGLARGIRLPNFSCISGHAHGRPLPVSNPVCKAPRFQHCLSRLVVPDRHCTPRVSPVYTSVELTPLQRIRFMQPVDGPTSRGSCVTADPSVQNESRGRHEKLDNLRHGLHPKSAFGRALRVDSILMEKSPLASDCRLHQRLSR